MTETRSGLHVDRPRVLVVDDEKFIRDILADFLSMEGYFVRTAEDGAAAVEELRQSKYDLVISDLKMPRMGGLELLHEISLSSPDTLTVIMTGFGTVETAIDAMKRGAYDYILKPFKVEEILHIVQRGIEKRVLAAENLRLREAVSLYKVSEAIASSLSLDEVMATVAASATTEIMADLVSIWLADGERGFFRRSLVRAPSIPGDFDTGSLDVAAVVTRLSRGEPLLEHDPHAASFYAEPPARPPTSIAIVPLKVRDSLIGWIAVASLCANKRFDEGQRKLLSIVASRAAAAIENARLYQDLQATFQQTIQGLARTIDKMDRYTAGHSERVARYAVALARGLGLPPEQVEVIRHSALMHDIGKIGCVMNLNKPGRLTSEEYEVFKRHPVYGRDIIEPIKFLKPVIPGVYLHHERWDGNGYPLGMRGKDIPLVARIIAVADTYDAMTSDRAYRRAVPHEVTLNEIETCSGSQFDPEIAGRFLEIIEATREELRADGHTVPE